MIYLAYLDGTVRWWYRQSDNMDCDLTGGRHDFKMFIVSPICTNASQIWGQPYNPQQYSSFYWPPKWMEGRVNTTWLNPVPSGLWIKNIYDLFLECKLNLKFLCFWLDLDCSQVCVLIWCDQLWLSVVWCNWPEMFVLVSVHINKCYIIFLNLNNLKYPTAYINQL